MTKAWSTKFDDIEFTEFLFITGDKSIWLTMTKDEALGENYGNQNRNIEKSSISCEPSQALMYNRAGNTEDPWISLTDHASAIPAGLIVYGENSYGGNNLSIKNNDGADVYIR